MNNIIETFYNLLFKLNNLIKNKQIYWILNIEYWTMQDSRDVL